MAEKLCPFDKNPCIREKCAIFLEKEECCSLAMRNVPVERKTKKEVKPDSGKEQSKFKAYLFD